MKPWLTAAVVLGLCGFAWATLGLLKERRSAQKVSQKAEASQATAPDASRALSTVAEPRGIGFGLTFARLDAGQGGTDNIALGCHAEPKPLDRPHAESCNPYQGDTSCRTVLPVACFQPGSGSVGATQPMMGALLKSADTGTQRCAAELGTGWRMAELHDGPGSAVTGTRGAGLSGSTRYWVHVNDQPGNCWDSPP